MLIHIRLFRFYMQGMWRDKINTHVNFPLEGLDMTQHLVGPQKNRSPYNLYAVSVSDDSSKSGLLIRLMQQNSRYCASLKDAYSSYCVSAGGGGG